MRIHTGFRVLGSGRFLHVAYLAALLVFLTLSPAALIGQNQIEQNSSRQNPEQVRIDRRAFKSLTHMPHRDALAGRGGAAHPSSPGAPAVAPQLNVFDGSLYIVGPTVTPTSTAPEAEEHIAVSPQNSGVLLAAISDFALNGGFNTTKYAFSADNGGTWAESYIPLDPLFGLPATGDGFFWFANSDPVVAIDTQGNAFLADLYLDAIDNGNGFYVSVANANTGFNFTVDATLPVKTNPDATATELEDKPWITVDNSRSATSGNVYASWSHFSDANTDYIAFSRSTHHAVTWSPLMRISPPSQDGAVQGSSLAVGPLGEIYLVYELFLAGNQVQQFLAKSADGGATFSSPVAVTPVFNDLTFSSTYRKNSFAAIAVNPLSGLVYMIYADQPGANSQVEFTRSADGGATFSSPIAINDSAAGQRFFPALAVDPSGALHMSWFDTRNSPSDASLYDVYATFSRNDGATFASNAQVTAASANAGTTTFIGDYAGIAAAGGFAHPVWTNGGGNNGQLQTSALQLP